MLKRWCWVVVEEEKTGCEEGLIAESRGGDVFVLVVSQTFFEKNDTLALQGLECSSVFYLQYSSYAISRGNRYTGTTVSY